MNFEIMVATDKPIYYVFSRGRLVGTYALYAYSVGSTILSII